MESMLTYKAEGIVYGKLWEPGQEGSYPARQLANDDRNALVSEAEIMLLDGSLDSGMGYERLLGALLVIEEIETVIVKGKHYHRSEYEYVFLGDLTDEQRKHLEKHLYQ